MPSMLVTVNISKGFETWSEMAKSMQEEAGAQGARIVWAAANPDETAVYVMMEVPDPEFMQTFGLRPDVVKAREAAGWPSGRKNGAPGGEKMGPFLYHL